MPLLPWTIITDDIILDRWSALVHRARGHGPEVYQDTGAFLQEVGLPGIRVRLQRLATSYEDGLLGRWRDFLAVNAAGLRQLTVYIGAFDVGNALVINWYLCSRVGLWQTVLEKGPYILTGKEPPRTLTPRLDMFTKDITVRAFATATYTALAQAVQLLMQRLGQDPAQLDHHAGFQGIT